MYRWKKSSSSKRKLSDKHDACRSLFIADLHLTDGRPEANFRFFHFLEHIAPGADALYILGDFFEYWVGDDDTRSNIAKEASLRLRKLTESGTPVYFMHGNRDFLLARHYAETCGMQLLDDSKRIDLYGTQTLLSHGDMFCTDDQAYQHMRKWLRKPWIQKLLLALPLGLRHRLAGQARQNSERAKTHKPDAIMDVNENAVSDAMRAAGVTRLIHGHTHRPNRHQLMIDGKAGERWVLPDWYETGGYLTCTESGCRLSSVFAADMPGGSVIG